MTREEQIRQAYETLHQYVLRLSEVAQKSKDEAESLWQRILSSPGVLRELSYYHDYGKFLGTYRVAGYTLVDVLVWQVDHFKAYMDRYEQVNRYRQERLLLDSLAVLLQMEENPGPLVEKMRNETGTDRLS